MELLFTSASGVSSQPRLLFAPAKVLRRPKPWVLSANKAQKAILLQVLALARWERENFTAPWKTVPVNLKRDFKQKFHIVSKL